MSTTGSISIALSAIERLDSPETKAGARVPHAISQTYSWTDGTADGSNDLLFSDERTVSASGSDNLDLAGSLSDVFGNTLTFAEVTAIVVKIKSGTGTIKVGGAASNEFQAGFTASGDAVNMTGAGSMFVQVNDAGWAVTAGTGDQFGISETGGANSVTYQIAIVGRSS